MTKRSSDSFRFHWINPHKKLLETFEELIPNNTDRQLREIILVDLFKLIDSLSDSRTWNTRLVKQIKGTKAYVLLEGRHELPGNTGHFRIYFTADLQREIIFGLHCHIKDTAFLGNDAIRHAQNAEIRTAERIWEDFLENNPEFI